MLVLPPPTKEDFDFQDDIQVDVENKGFTLEEMKALAGPIPPEFRPRGEKGVKDWFNKVWGKGRPPEIKNLRSRFGYQDAPFMTDLIAIANADGTPLEGMIKARSQKFNFYLMRCGVYIEPAEGEKFEALKFEIHYKEPRASTYAMLPGPQTKTILELGGTADIGFDGQGQFGFPKIALPQHGIAVGASVDAGVKAKFIVSFEYELKTIVVDAYGIGNRFCRWFMHKGDKLRNDVLFYPVIMTEKPVTEFECEFRAYFKINHSDWTNAEYFLKPPRKILVGD